MTEDDVRHGTRAGYYAHRRDDETACASCKAAAVKYVKVYNATRGNGARARVSALGTKRRLQALAAMGYTWRSLDRALGMANMCEKWANEPRSYVYASTARKVAAMYDRLSMTLPPENTRYEKINAARARSLARRNGWAPPLAWERIDDPTDWPRGVAVEIANIAAEQFVEDYDFLRREGYTRRQAAERMGITKKRLEKAIERHSRRVQMAS